MLAGRCTVLDFSRYICGPFATQILADLGATVIKVEPLDGVPERAIGPFKDGVSLYFPVFNRRKQSIALDLKTAPGRALAQRLACQADVLVENFVPGVMQRYGLDHAALRELNPRLVYASVSGFGQDGPMAQTKAFDQTIQALSGIMNLTGFPGQPPVRAGVNVADYSGGMMAAVGILCALLRREWQGRGSQVDVSLLDCALNLLDTAVLRHTVLGQNPSRLGNSRPGVATSSAFRAQDAWVFVAALEPSHAARLTALSGAQDEEALQRWIAARSVREVVDALASQGIPAAPVEDIPGLLRNPQLAHRQSLVEVEVPGIGAVPMAALPFRIDGQAAFAEMQPPRSPEIGEHTEPVLRELLGCSDDELKALRHAGAIA